MWLQSFALLQQDTHPHPRSHPSIQSALVFVQYRKVKRRLHLKKSHIKNRTNERTATHRPNFEKTETRKDSKQTQANRSTRTQKKTRKQKWITWRWKNILFKKRYTLWKRGQLGLDVLLFRNILLGREEKVYLPKEGPPNERTHTLTFAGRPASDTNERTNEQNWIHKTQNELKQFLWDYLKQSHPYSHPNLIHY